VTAVRRTVPSLNAMAGNGEKIAMLTGYDASFAAMEDRAGVDAILVGDSLGMVVSGHPTTLPVTLRDMAYHTRAVAAGSRHALIVADLPFGTYQRGPEQAYAAAAELMTAGAHMIKMEGGAWLAPSIDFIVTRGIPVCGHLGLLPQSVHQYGGYKTQGNTDASARQLRDDAQRLADAGVGMVVFEMVPAVLASEITAALAVPTIGIGAGPGCSGQVLVLYDMLGIYPGKPARFVRNFMTEHNDIEAAIAGYVRAVKEGRFPGPEHGY